MPRCVWILSVCALASAGAASAWAAEEPPDFARDVRPILEAHCFDCHGPHTQESGLRLDHGGALLAGGNSGPAVVPGKPDDSVLLKAIRGGSDGVSKMPPEGDSLQPAEIAIVRRWIEAGAKVPDEPPLVVKRRASDHWAFQPPAAGQVPSVRHASLVRNPIDSFVFAALEAAELEPSAAADRATLIRRLSLDLLGLPPTVAEVDAFLADPRDDAYEQLVDRLLSSPHYGERWARNWLDIARYADSNGYTIDGARSIWKYRDWVIGAFNRDLPFDRFTIEQLAGDLLENPSLDQLIATGFHRNTLVNEEGGTDPEQFRVEAVVDRVSTTGGAFLGLTVGCARCHDHKYDPISQREFYQLFAIFNGADEPTLKVPTDQESKELPALDAEIAQAETRLAAVDDNAAGRQAEWESSLGPRAALDWVPLEAVAASGAGSPIARLEDGSLLAGGDPAKNDVYTVTAPLPDAAIGAVRIELLPHESLPKQGPGRAANGNFVLSELQASIAGGEAGANGGDQRLEFANAWADYSAPKADIGLAIDGKSGTGWNISGPKEPNVHRTAIFFLKQPAKAGAGRTLSLTLDQRHNKPGYLLGRFRVSVSAGDREVLVLADEVRTALRTVAGERTQEQRDLLKREYQKVDPERVPLANRIEELKQQRQQMAAQVTTTLIMRERPEPRETRIHVRGDFLNGGAVVRPDVPEVLPPLEPRGKRADRLDLARWLVSGQNPLTARVTMNRLWQAYFGVGLVATENDFGLQGDKPTHPELLDWLAQALVAEGWSMKQMHRLIVCSHTYRQSSRVRPELTAVDPYNKLLGRQQRLRLEAETIRDSALAASGLLSRELGGPGVYPPQPQGIYKFTQQAKFWGESKNDDRYRRGLYTYLWRSSPYPFLKTFDVPDAVVACTRRPRSNTPLQALTLANDGAFLEMARGFAVQLLGQSCADDQQRIRLAFRGALSRAPSPDELTALADYLNGERARFAADQAAAREAAGDLAKGDPAKGGSSEAESARRADAAAWTMLARVLLNLDEFITRE